MGGPDVDPADSKEVIVVDFTTVAVQAHVDPPGRPVVDVATILKVGGTDPTAAMVVAIGDIVSNEVQHPQLLKQLTKCQCLCKKLIRGPMFCLQMLMPQLIRVILTCVRRGRKLLDQLVADH